MKIAKGLMPFLLIILAVICLTGCSHVDKTDVQAVITNELDLLKNLDSDTTQKYVSYKELFPDATKEIKLSNEVKEVFSLFFQNFDYEILSVNVDNDKKEATASLRLSTIDAASLAKDYGEASLKNAILKAADSEEQATEKNTDSMEERYLLLDQLLSNNNYATVERECTVELCNKGSNDDKDEWEIIRSHSLENNLVGGLMTYLSDNNLLEGIEFHCLYDLLHFFFLRNRLNLTNLNYCRLASDSEKSVAAFTYYLNLKLVTGYAKLDTCFCNCFTLCFR